MVELMVPPVVAKWHILTRGTVEPTPSPFLDWVLFGAGAIWTGCYLGRVSFGVSAILRARCHLGRVSFGLGFIWGRCHLGGWLSFKQFQFLAIFSYF